jgi:hypothetical protein
MFRPLTKCGHVPNTFSANETLGPINVFIHGSMGQMTLGAFASGSSFVKARTT